MTRKTSTTKEKVESVKAIAHSGDNLLRGTLEALWTNTGKINAKHQETIQESIREVLNH